MINLLLLQNLIRDFFSVTPENFAARLAQGNLASKNDIAVLVKNTDFDEKPRKWNKNVTLNKTKHVIVVNELIELSKKVKKYQQRD